MKDEERTKLERRDFLRGLGVAAGGAAAVVPQISEAAEKAEDSREQVKKRYQETEHVKRFYALNRL